MTDDWITANEALGMLKQAFGERSARLRICERAHAGMIRARADQFHRGDTVLRDTLIPKGFWWATGHEALRQDWVAGDFSTWIDHKIELKAFGVKFDRADIDRLLPASGQSTENVDAPDLEIEQVAAKLESLLPSAAQSFRQAVLDMRDESRRSYRGAALELREALREILDHLAPDCDVACAPGYSHETGRSGPTMKQKVRFILKARDRRSSIETAEQAVTAFEAAIAALTRAVYNRSSAAVHAGTDRVAVVQLRRYVVAVLNDILE